MTRLSTFVTNPGMLTSSGTVTVWINNEEGITPIELPITTDGVLELRMQLDMMRPVAPKKALMIKASSDIGKELELTEDTVKLVQDEADVRYVRALEEYQMEYVWHVVIHALDMEFKNAKGKVVTDFEEKKAILILNGLTGEHLSTIFNSILKLTEAHYIELEEYIEQSVGITAAIKRKIISRSKKNPSKDKPGQLYNDVRLMAEYQLSPEEFSKVSFEDKRAMNYTLLMKYHMEAEQLEQNERMQKLEANKRKVSGSLPTFSNGGR